MAARGTEKSRVHSNYNNDYQTRPTSSDPSPYGYMGSGGSSDRRWLSWLIPLFVVVNVGMFAVVMFVNDCPRKNRGCVGDSFLGRFSFENLRENPLFGPSSLTLEKLGALEWKKVVREHEGWRLVSCMWLHAGVIHLLANMLSLVFIGIRLEQQFGFVRVGIIYSLSGFGGSILSLLFIQQSISVGASGALFGLLGAMLSELLTNWTIYANKAAALFTLLFIIAINLALGLLPRVDNFAHIGGFMAGFLLGFVLLIRPRFGWLDHYRLPGPARAKSKYMVYQYILFLVALVLLIIGFVGGLVMLFKGDNGHRHCSWCHYLICLPSSKWSCQN
ncbi:RHOMBOID-like protein [Drosera capensis]